MPIHIRPATPADFPTIADLTVTAYVGDGHLTDDDPYVRELRDVAARAAVAEVLVATQHDQVVGAVAWCAPGSRLTEVSTDREGEFRMLAVAPSARGQGIARTLVGHLVARARREGLHGLAICSMHDQTKAHALYASLGFERAPDRDWTPEPGVNLLAFVLPL